MKKFIFYGLGRDGAVLVREEISAARTEDARAVAQKRTAEFPRIELWEDAVCVLRERRPQG